MERIKETMVRSSKRSWWKAPLLIAAYFYVRVLAETWVIRRGAFNAEVELTVETLTEGNILNLMTHAPMEYFLQMLGLTVLIIVTGKLLGFKFLILNPSVGKMLPQH